MTARNIFYWLGFTVACIWLQHFIQGVDFLVVGLILLLQEGRWPKTLWLALLWILIQDGSGNLAFGPALLWYAGAVALFHAGRWLFEAENILFILLLGLSLGVWHLGLVWLMASLQDVIVSGSTLLRESFVQALIILPGWLAAHKLQLKFRITDVRTT